MASLLPVLARARAYWSAAQPIRGLLPLLRGLGHAHPLPDFACPGLPGKDARVFFVLFFFARGNAGLGRGFPERCGSFASGRRSGRGGAAPAENTRFAAFLGDGA